MTLEIIVPEKTPLGKVTYVTSIKEGRIGENSVSTYKIVQEPSR